MPRPPRYEGPYADARRLFSEFERQDLSLRSIEVFHQALAELIEEVGSKAAIWTTNESKSLVTTYTRLFLQRVMVMNRANEQLSLEVMRTIHFHVFPAAVAVAQSDRELSMGYDALLSSWTTYRDFTWAISGDTVHGNMRRFMSYPQ